MLEPVTTTVAICSCFREAAVTMILPEPLELVV